MQLYIDTAATTIKVRNASFMVTNKSISRLISPRRVSSIAIVTNVTINSSVIKLAASFEIPIFYYDRVGNLIAQLRGPSFLKQSKLRYLQTQFMNNAGGRTWVIKQLVLKADLQIQTLERYGRDSQKAKVQLEEISESINTKKMILIKIDPNKHKVSNTIMRIEGGIAKLYFKGINMILPENYRFSKRSRQPGEDYFNTCLNYLYGMTYGEITKAVHAAGLDTFVGALHHTPYKENLIFDCIEPFRPIIDRLLIELCQNHLLNETHFKPVKNGFWLNKEGKKLIIENYYEYLNKRIMLNQKVMSIQHHIYALAKKLKKEIKSYDSNVPHFL